MRALELPRVVLFLQRMRSSVRRRLERGPVAEQLGILLVCLAALSAGCAQRKVVLRSEPAGAQLSVNGKNLGVTPAEMVDVPGPMLLGGRVYEVHLSKACFEETSAQLKQELQVRPTFSWSFWPPWPTPVATTDWVLPEKAYTFKLTRQNGECADPATAKAE